MLTLPYAEEEGLEPPYRFLNDKLFSRQGQYQLWTYSSKSAPDEIRTRKFSDFKSDGFPFSYRGK